MADLVRQRSGIETGSTLLLFPAGFMVVMILAAIAIDLSTVHLARRELLRTASQAADDGAAMIDPNSVRAGEHARLDSTRAANLVRFEIAAAHLPGTIIGTPRIEVDEARGIVDVDVTMDVNHIFGHVVPGASAKQRITVHTSGHLINTD